MTRLMIAERRDVDAESLERTSSRAVFGNHAVVAEGWYWALESRKLRRRTVKGVQLCGKELVVYRGDDDVVRAAEAFCPHMGAHLENGRVDGDGIRCFFHGWKFGPTGACVDVPSQEKPARACVKMFQVEERYGLVWIFVGENPYPLFEIPELAGKDVDTRLGAPYTKGCHPNIVMVNAIDEQHFHTVHHLPVELSFDVEAPDIHTVTFANTTRIPLESLWQRFLARFYDGALTYSMCYRAGSVGSVTVGPDLQHFHIIFAMRPTGDGKAEGRTILVTGRRRSLLGRIYNVVLLALSKIVGDYFAHGDTKVFQTIKWNFQHAVKKDRSIVKFIQHLEKQPAVAFGTWEPSTSNDANPDDGAHHHG